jgi:drug/metabolite transporter (DMT)-like permease
VVIINVFAIFLALFGVLVSILPHESMRIIESLLIWVVMTFWGAVSLCSTLIPKNAEAESRESHVIANPNVFFFGHLCIISSVLLMASWFQHDVHTDGSIITTQWILLCASSLLF